MLGKSVSCIQWTVSNYVTSKDLKDQIITDLIFDKLLPSYLLKSTLQQTFIACGYEAAE